MKSFTHGQWSNELVLRTFQLHHGTDGSQQVTKALQKLLTVLTPCAPVRSWGREGEGGRGVGGTAEVRG